MRSFADQEGFSLIELLVAMTLMIVILGATLTTLTSYESNASNDRKSQDAQDRARAGLRQLARNLRNVASPTEGERDPIDKATGTDIIFQSVDPQGPAFDANVANVRRVRYCLDTSDAQKPVVRYQHQRWNTLLPPAVPAHASCPDAGWTAFSAGVGSRVLAEGVVNARGAAARPIFSFRATTPACAAAPVTTACLPEIVAVRTKLFVDMNGLDRRPVEAPLETGVALRNQNRPPTASASATPVSPDEFLLNATASVDPEGETLKYEWYLAGSRIGEGAIFRTQRLAVGTHTIELRATDSGGLSATAEVTVSVAAPIL